MLIKEILRKIISDDILTLYHVSVLRNKNKAKINKIYEHYKDVEQTIKEREDKTIRFASYVIFDSTFAAYGLMDVMIQNKNTYNPKIVICPDVSRGEEHLLQQYRATKKFFIEKYGSEYVIDGYDERTGAFIDVADQFDVIYCANPYDTMVNEVHSVNYLSKKNVLPIYISYGCLVDKYSYKYVMPRLEMSLFWKVFADEYYSYQDYKKYELIKGKNVEVTGYAKMDSLVKFQRTLSEKKKIIIAPHHTINMPALPLSNFLQFYNFILELPQLFPNIDFIFRPHPLLFVNLEREGFWTKKEIEDYIKKITDSGMIYSYGGDYLDVFQNSDAIIHDCASFIMEYLFTGKPCCFVAKKENKNIFSKLGKACLKNYYMAYNKQDIIDFINNVVVIGADPLIDKRKKFFERKLTINFPQVSKTILEKITEDIKE